MPADPHDIIPDGFLERYDTDDPAEALAAAERAKSTTDTDTRPRCPICGTTRIHAKARKQDMTHRIETDYKCYSGHHFDEPAPSVEDAPDFEPVDKRRTPFRWIGEIGAESTAAVAATDGGRDATENEPQ